MKKMIWIGLIAGVACVALMLSSMPVALAEEEAMEAVAATETTFADYFRQEWLDKLVQYAAVALGAVTAVAATVNRVRKAHRALQEDGKQLRQGQQQLAVTQQQLAEAKALYDDAAQALQTVAEACRQSLEAQQNAQAQLARVCRAMTVAYCNTAELVQSGHAKTIAQLLEAPYEPQQE